MLQAGSKAQPVSYKMYGLEAVHPELGSNWENQALFDLDDNPLPSSELFGR
jgi:hypothetical protein